MPSNQKGIGSLIVLVLIVGGLGLATGGYFLGSQNNKTTVPETPQPSPSELNIPVATPSIVPTISPSPAPSIISIPSPIPTQTPVSKPTQPVKNGVNLEGIKYTLPSGWNAQITDNFLQFTPSSGGGYLAVMVYDYLGTTGRREFYCQTLAVCTSSSSFAQMQVGNIEGYKGSNLDNSGGGPEYFGAKGNKFYIISSYGPPTEGEFNKNFMSVLNSLIF